MARVLYGAILSLVAASVLAHELKLGELRITHPWTHASPLGATAAPIYMTIATMSAASDRLLGASTPIADGTEFHRHVQQGSKDKVEVVDALSLAKDSPIELSPDALCIALIGLHAPLQEFDTFPLTLNFERAGPKTVEVTVEEPDAAEPREDYGL